MFISYAKDGEDVVFDRVFGQDRRGLYIEIGAGDGGATKHLHELGWTGICVERNPSQRAALMLARPGLVTSDVISATGLSSAVVEAGRSHVDLLRIDATELQAAEALAPLVSAWKPRVVVLQTASSDLEESALGEVLRTAGYVLATFDGVNTYFAQAEDARILPLLYPACSRDDFLPERYGMLAEENRRLSLELEQHGRIELARPGADRALLSRPSSLARRYATRHDFVETPFILLDRVAVVATPETGGPELAELMSVALGVEVVSEEHLADVVWADLPARVVMAIPLPYAELSQFHLLSNAFRIVSTARDPVDSLFSHWRSELAGDGPQAVSEASRFVTWAGTPEAEARLDINGRWLVEPGTIRVDYELLSLDPALAIAQLCTELGVEAALAEDAARRVAEVSDQIRERLLGRAVDRQALSISDESLLADSLKLAFERLGLYPASASGRSDSFESELAVCSDAG